MRLRRRADRVHRDLQPAVGAVLEADRRGQPARHLAVGLRLRGAGADRVPADQVAEVLRRERVERLRSGRQAHPGERGEELPRADDALVDAERVVHVRVVDEALPPGDGARFLEVDTHDHEQRVGDALGEAHEPAGVLERSALGSWIEHGPIDDEQPRVAAIEDGPDGRAPAGDRIGGRGRERHLGLHGLRRGHVLHARNVDVLEPFGRHLHIASAAAIMRSGAVESTAFPRTPS